MFDLLGFDGELLKLKYENDSKVEDIKSFIEREMLCGPNNPNKIPSTKLVLPKLLDF